MYFNGDLNLDTIKDVDFIDNWQNFANGVVAKAADDYRMEYAKRHNIRKQLKNTNLSEEDRYKLTDDLKSVNIAINVLRKFFAESPWMDIVHMDGSYILSRLDKELKEELAS